MKNRFIKTFGNQSSLSQHITLYANFEKLDLEFCYIHRPQTFSLSLKDIHPRVCFYIFKPVQQESSFQSSHHIHVLPKLHWHVEQNGQFWLQSLQNCDESVEYPFS